MTPQELKNSILQLAIQGKLVEQRPQEGTAEELYRQIQKEKQRLIKAGTIKKEKPLQEIAEDEKPFDIPEGWKWMWLPEITYSVGNKYNQILAKDVKPQGKYPAVSQGKQLIDGYSDLENKLINDLPLIMFGDHTRNVKFIDFPFVISADGTKFMKAIGIEVKYLLYWMTFVAEHLRNRGYARHFTVLVKEPVPLPPLAEQKRIVDKIEELLPYIDRYEQAFSKLEEFNKRFPDEMQKSILQTAIQGKLVEQRPEEGTGEELYRQIQKEKQRLIKEGKIKKEKPLPEIAEDEKPFDIPESWKWVRLGEILTYQNGYAFNSSEMSESCNGYPVIKSGNLMTLKVVIKGKNDYIDIPTEKMLECQINKGDMLMCLSSQSNNPEPLGKTAIYEFDTPALLNQRVLKMKPLNPSTTKFLYFTINSKYFHFTVSHQGGGSAQANLKLEHVLNMIIPLPPLPEQKRIVAKLEEILPLCEKLKR